MTQLEEILIPRFNSKNQNIEDHEMDEFLELLNSHGIEIDIAREDGEIFIRKKSNKLVINIKGHTIVRKYSNALENSDVNFKSLALVSTHTKEFDFHGAKCENLDTSSPFDFHVSNITIHGSIKAHAGRVGGLKGKPLVFENSRVRFPKIANYTIFKNCEVKSTTNEMIFKNSSLFDCEIIPKEKRGASEIIFHKTNLCGGKILQNSYIGDGLKIIFEAENERGVVHKNFEIEMDFNTTTKSNNIHIEANELENVVFRNSRSMSKDTGVVYLRPWDLDIPNYTDIHSHGFDIDVGDAIFHGRCEIDENLRCEIIDDEDERHYVHFDIHVDNLRDVLCKCFVYHRKSLDKTNLVDYFGSKSPFSIAIVDRNGVLISDVMNGDNIGDFSMMSKALELTEKTYDVHVLLLGNSMFASMENLYALELNRLKELYEIDS